MSKVDSFRNRKNVNRKLDNNRTLGLSESIRRRVKNFLWGVWEGFLEIYGLSRKILPLIVFFLERKDFKSLNFVIERAGEVLEWDNIFYEYFKIAIRKWIEIPEDFPVNWRNLHKFMEAWEKILEFELETYEWEWPEPWTKQWFDEKLERREYLKFESVKILKKYWTMYWCWIIGREEIKMITGEYQQMCDLFWFDIWVRNYVFLLPEWKDIENLRMNEIEILKRRIKWLNKRTLQLLGWYIKEKWISWKYLFEDIIEYVKDWKELDIRIVIDMLKEDIYPTSRLLDYVLRWWKRRWKRRMQKLKNIKQKYKKKWCFDINNQIHVDLEYIKFRKFVDWAYKDKHWKWYRTYLDLLRQSKKWKERDKGFENKYYKIAAEESLVAYNFIEKLKEEYWFVNVFSNMSYGKVIVWPFEEELEEDERINYRRVRIGSSECHGKEEYIKKDLFSKEDIKKLFKWPVVILDWTKHKSIPDSHIGFKSWFYILNKVLADIKGDRKFIEENYSESFRKSVEDNGWYEELYSYLREIVITNRLYRLWKYFKFLYATQNDEISIKTKWSDRRWLKKVSDINFNDYIPVFFADFVYRRWEENWQGYFDDTFITDLMVIPDRYWIKFVPNFFQDGIKKYFEGKKNSTRQHDLRNVNIFEE